MQLKKICPCEDFSSLLFFNIFLASFFRSFFANTGFGFCPFDNFGLASAFGAAALDKGLAFAFVFGSAFVVPAFGCSDPDDVPAFGCSDADGVPAFGCEVFMTSPNFDFNCSIVIDTAFSVPAIGFGVPAFDGVFGVTTVSSDFWS